MHAKITAVAALLGAAFSIAPLPSDATRSPVGGALQRDAFAPTLQVRAPGAFDAQRPVHRSVRARYRADAQILLPLLVTSLRIGSRTGVGTASTDVRDVTLPSGERVLAYEFYAASIPERARGLDRLGFFREVVIGAGESRETAYFGAMSVSKEQTLEEAKRAIAENPSLAAYDVIDGLVTRASARATSYRVTLPRSAPDAAAFFDRVARAVDPGSAKPKPTLNAPPGRPLDGHAFLGAFESLLQAAAAAPARARGLSRSFVFGGEPRTIELRDQNQDLSRGREWAGRALVARPEAVQRLGCRIVAPSWKVDFDVWIEVPAATAGGPPPFVVPLRVEYLPRAFLRLVFEREP